MAFSFFMLLKFALAYSVPPSLNMLVGKKKSGLFFSSQSYFIGSVFVLLCVFIQLHHHCTTTLWSHRLHQGLLDCAEIDWHGDQNDGHPVRKQRRTHRGSRGWNKEWGRAVSRQQGLMEERRSKLCLPSRIMGHLRSLDNKMDKLVALVRNWRDIFESGVFNHVKWSFTAIRTI